MALAVGGMFNTDKHFIQVIYFFVSLNLRSSIVRQIHGYIRNRCTYYETRAADPIKNTFLNINVRCKRICMLEILIDVL